SWQRRRWACQSARKASGAWQLPTVCSQKCGSGVPGREASQVNSGVVMATDAGAGLLEKGHAGREAVDEVLAADRAQLALGEETGQRHGTDLGPDGAGVVVRPVEQAGATAVAGKQQGGLRPGFVGRQVQLQQGVQVLVSRRRIAYVELHRLADAHAVR